MSATDGTLRFSSIGRACDRIVVRVVIASTCGAFAIAVFLLARRAAGAFSSPLPVPQLVATAVAFVVWALLAGELSSRSPFFVAIAIAILLTLALACSYPGGHVVDWLVWPAAMFAVALCPPLVLRREQKPAQIKIATAGPEPDGESDTEKILQQVTRTRTADGCETVHGTLVAEFAAGERQTTLYVAFCPPFERLPDVEADIADDSDATVKLSQVLHNGAQFDVRLPEPADQATRVVVEFFAVDSKAED